MKKSMKIILTTCLSFIFLVTISAFMISDPYPDFNKKEVDQLDNIAIAKIETKNTVLGSFKSSVDFKQGSTNHNSKDFYGQNISIKDNPNMDQILVGVCNNLISRIEILNKNELIETKELGFMNKMTWGDTQKISVEFYDQTNSKHKDKSNISMRFYSGTGFFGDIATINLDLTKYGDLSGDKVISVFSKSINIQTITNKPEFSNLSIWKDYKSFD